MASNLPPIPSEILRTLDTIEANRSVIASFLSNDRADEDAADTRTHLKISATFEPASHFQRTASDPLPIDGLEESDPKTITPPLEGSGVSTSAGVAPARARSGDAAPQTAYSSSTYYLGEIIGRGGQGEVYHARQGSLLRDVAIKVLTDGDRKEFLREAYTSGALDHPNIVPVVDLGHATVGGDQRPMIAMKLLRGRPWNRVLYDEAPSAGEPRDAFLSRQLGIFLSVCNAVDFAHSKGIIHRDLKPSQVMIGEFGEVYLVDWGMAVHVGNNPPPTIEGLGSMLHTLHSASNPAGTPAYMAPEQASIVTSGLGIHTDVYLLGAILHELVAGLPPHASMNARAALLRAMVNDVEPLPEDCPAELRTIIERAMATNPGFRFANARDIRRAVEDYITGAGRERESVAVANQAAEELSQLRADDYDGFMEVGRKLSRALELWPANPAALLSRDTAIERHAEAAIVAGDLRLAGTLISGLRHKAVEGHLQAKIDAARLSQLRTARQRQQFIGTSLILLAIVIVGGIIAHFSITEQRDLAETRRQQAERNEKIAEERRREAELNLEVATEHGNAAAKLVVFVLNDLRAAMQDELSIDRGITIPKANEISHNIAGRVAAPVIKYFGDLDSTSWPARLRLDLADRMQSAATAFQMLNRLEEAERLASASLDIHQRLLGTNAIETAESLGRLSLILDAKGKFTEAQELAKNSHEILLATLGATDSRTIDSFSNLAATYATEGRQKEMEEIYSQVLTLKEDIFGPEHPETAKALTNLGAIMHNMARFDEAEELQWRAVHIWERNPPEDPVHYASLMQNLSILLRDRNKIDDALRLARRAVELKETRFGPSHPETSSALMGLATILQSRKELVEAESIMAQVLNNQIKAYGPDHIEVTGALQSLASLKRDLGKYEEAKELFERALANVDANQGPDEFITALICNNLGSMLQHQEKNEEALPYLERALKLFSEEFGVDHPHVASARTLMGMAQRSLKQYDEALANFERSLAIREKSLGADHPAVAISLSSISSIHRIRGHFSDAKSPLERAIEIRTKANGPQHPETAVLRFAMGELLIDMGQTADGEQLMRDAYAIVEKVLTPTSKKMVEIREKMAAIGEPTTVDQPSSPSLPTP